MSLTALESSIATTLPGRLRLHIPSPRRPAVFIDLRSLLVEHPAATTIAGWPTPALRLTDAAAQAISLMAAGLDGYSLIVVTAAGDDPSPSLEAMLRSLFADCDATLDGCHACLHDPKRSTHYRGEPNDQLQNLARELGVLIEDSWLIGAAPDDIEAALRAGCRTIQLAGTCGGDEVQWGEFRSPHYLVHGLDDAARVIAESAMLPRSVSDDQQQASGRIAGLPQ